MKLIKRILTFASLLLFYIIFREFLQLYVYFSAIHIYAGYVFVILSIFVLVYYVGIPVYRIIKLKTYPQPVLEKENEPFLIKERIKVFKKNPFILQNPPETLSGSKDRLYYDQCIQKLKEETHIIRKSYVRKIFYSTSVAQNGFLDAILILSASINLVKEIFVLYNGRSSMKDLFNIGRNIYYAMAIAGSEGVEIATEELFSKFSTEGIKSVPFIDKILGSLADGYVNALLLTRISYIAENYCVKTHIESQKSLNPSARFVVDITRETTSDIISDLKKALSKLASNKFKDFTRFAARPVLYVWQTASTGIQTTSDSLKNVVMYGGTILSKLSGFLIRSRL